ncbi:unnamed protein product [Ectocarpus sp. 13 AM-2016]
MLAPMRRWSPPTVGTCQENKRRSVAWCSVMQAVACDILTLCVCGSGGMFKSMSGSQHCRKTNSHNISSDICARMRALNFLFDSPPGGTYTQNIPRAFFKFFLLHRCFLLGRGSDLMLLLRMHNRAIYQGKPGLKATPGVSVFSSPSEVETQLYCALV